MLATCTGMVPVLSATHSIHDPQSEPGAYLIVLESVVKIVEHFPEHMPKSTSAALTMSELENIDQKVESKINEEEEETVDDNQSANDDSVETKSTVVIIDTSASNSTDEIGAISSVRVVVLGIVLLTIGAMGFYHLPGMIASDAKGSKVVNSIYCAVITLTTIGFGDICPDRTLAPIGKLFIVLFAFSGLGFFCGPMLDVASTTWATQIPGGIITLSCVTIGIGAALFSNLEDMSQSDAIYASFIVGTTIGYGDFTPKSDIGKLAVALYAIMVVNVMAGLLKPSRIFLEDLCRVRSSSDNVPVVTEKTKIVGDLKKKKDD